MSNLIKYAFDHKGWVVALFIAAFGAIISFFLEKHYSNSGDSTLNIFHLTEDSYHKTSSNVAEDCSSNKDDSVRYLDYHIDMLGFDENTRPDIVFDTAIWGLAMSDCHSNDLSKEKKPFPSPGASQ